IFRQPGKIPAGKTSDILVSNYDFLRTVLSYLDLADHMPMQPPSPGRDFSRAIKSEPIEWDNVIFYEMETCRAIREERWKYVARHPSGPHELYDMQADPRERVNLYGQPGMEETAARLARRLDDFFTRYADPQYDIWHNGRSKATRHTQ